MIQHRRLQAVSFISAFVIPALLAGTAAADIAPFRPLTFWLPEHSSPSPVAIVIAGLALSAAVVMAGIWWTSAATSPKARSRVGCLVAAGVAAVLLFTAEFYWERIVNRNDGSNLPPFDRWQVPPTDGAAPDDASQEPHVVR